MLRLAVVLPLLSVLSCSQDKPTAQAAFDEEAGPWETVEINGATYKCVAGQPQSVGQVLSENDDGLYNAPGFFVEARVEAGTYYVKVRGLSSSTTGSYSLAVGAWLPSAGKVAVSHQQQLRP